MQKTVIEILKDIESPRFQTEIQTINE
jgi:hypothetical protein